MLLQGVPKSSLSRSSSDKVKPYSKHAEEASWESRRAATKYREFSGYFICDKMLYLSGGLLLCPSKILTPVDYTISTGAEEKKLEEHIESSSKVEIAETS